VSRGVVDAAAAVGRVSGTRVGRRDGGGSHCARDCDRDCGTGGGRRGAGRAVDVLLLLLLPVLLLLLMQPSSVVTLVPGGRVGAEADAGGLGRICRRAMSGLSGLS
jgi:hypothetical protein